MGLQMRLTVHKEMATKPFTGTSRTVSETQTELPQKETETALQEKETESELPQGRSSDEESSNQTLNIRGNEITATGSREVGVFHINNEYHEGGAAADHHQGREGQNKTDNNIDGNKIDSKEGGECVGIGKIGNKYYNWRKDEARSSSKEEGTSKKPWYKPWKNK